MRLVVLEDYGGGDHHLVHGRLFRHVHRALRLGLGDSFAARSEAGEYFHCTIESVGPTSLAIRVQPRGRVEQSGPRITLIQCLPKAAKMDFVIRQATEAGVFEIAPASSRFAVSEPRDVEARQTRWALVAREAAQQSGAPVTPEILPVRPLLDAVRLWRNAGEGVGLFFHQAPLAQGSLHRYLSECPNRLALVIGPEGGLAGEELSALQSEGFVPVFLGPMVLRTETAALYAVAAIRTILFERDSWKV